MATSYWGFAGMLSLLMFRMGHPLDLGIFFEGIFQIFIFMFLVYVAFFIPYLMVPAAFEVISPGGMGDDRYRFPPAEFLFTRAISRSVLYRAKAAAVSIYCIPPFLINVALTPWMPNAEFSGVDATERFHRYLNAFPSMAQIGPPGKGILIPHGTIACAAWLAWGAAVAVILLQGYGSLIARKVTPGNKWTKLIPAGPALALLAGWTVLLHTEGLRWALLVEDNFLLFAAHPILMFAALIIVAGVIQIACERRYSRLEVL